MTPQHKELLTQLGKTSHGLALKAFLEEKKAELNNVELLTSWDETLGNKRAVKIIKDLFSFMEEKSPTEGKKTSFE